MAVAHPDGRDDACSLPSLLLHLGHSSLPYPRYPKMSADFRASPDVCRDVHGHKTVVVLQGLRRRHSAEPAGLSLSCADEADIQAGATWAAQWPARLPSASRAKTQTTVVLLPDSHGQGIVGCRARSSRSAEMGAEDGPYQPPCPASRWSNTASSWRRRSRTGRFPSSGYAMATSAITSRRTRMRSAATSRTRRNTPGGRGRHSPGTRPPRHLVRVMS